MSIPPPTVGVTRSIFHPERPGVAGIGNVGSPVVRSRVVGVSPQTDSPYVPPSPSSVRDLQNLVRQQHEEVLRGIVGLHDEHDDTQLGLARVEERVGEKKTFLQELMRDFLKSGATVAASVIVTFMVQRMIAKRREDERAEGGGGDEDGEEEEAGMAEASATAMNLAAASASTSGYDPDYDDFEDGWEE